MRTLSIKFRSKSQIIENGKLIGSWPNVFSGEAEILLDDGESRNVCLYYLYLAVTREARVKKHYSSSEYPSLSSLSLPFLVSEDLLQGSLFFYLLALRERILPQPLFGFRVSFRLSI
jgi:hypothetical protein